MGDIDPKLNGLNTTTSIAVDSSSRLVAIRDLKFTLSGLGPGS